MEYSKQSTSNSNNSIIQRTPTKRTAELENEHTDLSNEESDSQSSSPKKLKVSLVEENHLSKLFTKAQEFLQETMKVSEDELKKGIGTVKTSFIFKAGNQFSDIDFDKSENLCAYFYRYSLLSPELSRSKISEAVSNCKILRFCLNRREINVVSVGGGPGFDVVGMCSALYNKVQCKKLNFVVVDNVKRWKSFLNVVECLLLEGDFGDASSMFKESDGSISFICEDVCKTQKEAFYEVLSNSDVILMKSILSIIPFSSKDVLAENVVARMKVGAVLLFIDSPYYNFENLGLEKIYSSWTENDPPFSPIKKDPPFSVRGSPLKNCGPGISYSSKAQIAVFHKKA